MAFGFSPKFVVSLPLNDLTPVQFLSFAVEAAKRLGWNTSPVEANGFVAYTKSSMSSWAEQVRFTIENGTATIKSECITNQLFDWGKNKRNIRDFENEFKIVRETVHPDLLELKPEEISKELENRRDQPAFDTTATKENAGGFLSLFKPREGYFATPIIIILNILIFILMVSSGTDWFAPSGEELVKWGADYGPLTFSGEWWRLLTSCFVHIGIFHLVLNMYAFAYVGLLLEPRLGTARFTTAYLFTGVAASTVSLWWHPDILSAGASGAIFGMYGVFLAMLTTKLIEESTRKALLTSIVIFIGYNLVNGLKDGIDNAAHIGGLIAGLVAGYAFYPSLKNPSATNLKSQTILAFIAIIFFSSFLLLRNTNRDLGTYQEKMKSFETRESAALEVFQFANKNAPQDSILYEIKNNGISNWEENLKMLNELENLKLPERIHKRDRKLIEYCNLRIQSYNLMYSAIKDGRKDYDDSIAYYNKQIEQIINDLKEE